MARPEQGEQVHIGEALKRARARKGLEIAAVEERTKIRTKYLRALEGEDWEVLPSPAYAKGYLRTYAELLGLDADALTDAFRRQVEAVLEDENSYRLSEPVLESRPRHGDRRPPWGLLALLGGAAVIALAAVAVAGLFDGEEPGPEGGSRPAAAKKGAGDRPDRDAPSPFPVDAGDPGMVSMRLAVREDVRICLLGPGDDVLIPGQILSAGTVETFERPRFELRFPGGYQRSQFGLVLNGRTIRLPKGAGPAAFALRPGEDPRELPEPGTGCP